MQRERKHLILAAALVAPLLFGLTAQVAQANPPLPVGVLTDLGTALISPEDLSTLSALNFSGRGQRWDWSPEGGFVLRSAYLFEARYRDAPPVAVEVNTTLGDAMAASGHASRYAGAVG